MSTPQTSKARVFPYAVVDVFAEAALQGNMLCIFPDARGLTDSDMQALARETNLSETTFIFPRPPEVERESGVRVRIFTVQEELPFAGHPTLGTASWLYWNHPVLAGSEHIRLELNVGAVPVQFAAGSPGESGVHATMRQQDPVLGALHDPALVARAIGLDPVDLDPTLPIQTVSTGMPFCIVPLRSVSVARRLNIPQVSACRYLEASDAKFFYCIARVEAGGNNDASFHARMQFYNGEDPATGSAAGCAIAFLVHHGAVPPSVPVVIRQGVEMLRPSRLFISASLVDGRVVDVFVGGRTIPVANGQFFLP